MIEEDELYEKVFCNAAGPIHGLRHDRLLALEAKVSAVIESYEDLFVEDAFDPANLVREFHIACADHAMFYVEPAVTLASKIAPGVTFRLQPNDDNWATDLQRHGILTTIQQY